MARPQKEGLDYFSLDVAMDQDDKVVLVEAKHKITGFAVLIKLLMKIYKEGYFYMWTEREQLLFSSRINVDINNVVEVVNDCIKWGLFNSSLYEKYQILTSCGIQKRYIEATKRRKEITLIHEYLIVEPPAEGVHFKVHFINVDKNTVSEMVNVDINPTERELTSTFIPKVKESKVKESKGNQSKEATPYSEIQEIFNRICVSFAKVQKMSNSRKDKLRTRWLEIETIKTFEEICTKMESSNFLKGDNSRKWMPTFDWLLENDNNWVKVIEGSYDNNPGSPKNGSGQGGKQIEDDSRDSRPWENDPYIQAMYGPKQDG